MSNCPHCQKRISIRRLFLSDMERPYQCPTCGGRSHIVLNRPIPLLTVCVFIVIFGATLFVPLSGSWALMLFGLLWVASLVLLLANCRYEPVPEAQSDAKPHPSGIAS
jgi:hypothetical protein